MDRPTLQEQLDACRDAAQAADDPMLRELAEAMKSDPQISDLLKKQWTEEETLKSQLSLVPVPNGLREHLASSFRQAVAQSEQDYSRLRIVTERAIDASPEKESAAEIVEPKKPSLSPKRRLPIKTIGMLTVPAVALVLILGIFFRWTGEVEWDSGEFAKQAIVYCSENAGEWIPINSKSASPLPWDPNVLPIVKNLLPQRWKVVESKYDGTWMVWELESAPNERVYVLAAKADWSGDLPPVLSDIPIKSTGNWSVGVCRVEGVSYAVVVEGNEQRFRSIVQSSQYAHVGVIPLHKFRAASNSDDQSGNWRVRLGRVLHL